MANFLTQAKDNLAKESISLDRIVAHLLGPNTLQYLKNPSEVHWVDVDVELKSVSLLKINAEFFATYVWLFLYFIMTQE